MTSMIAALSVLGMISTFALPALAGYLAEKRGYSFYGWSLVGFGLVGVGVYLASVRQQPLGFGLFLVGPVLAFVLPNKNAPSSQRKEGVTLNMPLPPPGAYGTPKFQVDKNGDSTS